MNATSEQQGLFVISDSNADKTFRLVAESSGSSDAHMLNPNKACGGVVCSRSMKSNRFSLLISLGLLDGVTAKVTSARVLRAW